MTQRSDTYAFTYFLNDETSEKRLQELKAEVRAYNANPNKEYRRYIKRFARLGPKSPHAHKYARNGGYISSQRICFEHAAHFDYYVFAELTERGWELARARLHAHARALGLQRPPHDHVIVVKR